MSRFSLGKLLWAIAAMLFFVTPNAASAQVSRVIKFTNECSHPIEFVIRNNPNGSGWESHGWFNLQPGASSTFSDNGRTLTQSDGYSLYFWARATDSSGIKWEGDNKQYFKQAQYPFMEVNTANGSDGQLQARITCPGSGSGSGSGVSGGGSGQVVKFINDCSHPIKFIIRNNPLGTGWASHGWYNLSPGASSTFSDGGATLQQHKDYSLYFWGQSTDGSGLTWKGDNSQDFDGSSYDFMELKTDDAGGEVVAHITCSSSGGGGGSASGGVSSGGNQQVRVIKFYNDCSSPIEFIVRNTTDGNTWKSHGWYKLRPNWSSTFSDYDGLLEHRDGYELYAYARATDGSGRLWEGTNKQSFGSKVYPFLAVNTQVSSDGQVYTHFTCK